MTQEFDPKLDLVFERVVNISPEQAWAAWTQPELIKKWFTPAPWKTIDCEIDLRPGGIFRTTFLTPEGEEFPNLGCFLEVIENRKLVWTCALGPGFRPLELPDSSHGAFFFTAILTFEPASKGTKYRAQVIHSNEAGRKQHEEMGFETGWGLALDQLVAMTKEM